MNGASTIPSPNAGNGPRIMLGKNIYSDSAVLNHG